MASKNNKSRFRVSLFVNYVAFFVAIEVVSLSVFGWILFTSLSVTWENQQKQKLVDNAVSLSSIYGNSIPSDSLQATVDYSELCYAVAGVSEALNAGIYISDLDGNVVFCNDVANSYNKNNQQTICQRHAELKVPGEILTGILADGVMATRSDFGGIYDDDYFVAASVVTGKDGKDIQAIVFAVQGLDVGLMSYESTFLRSYILSALAVIAITSLIVYLSTYTITRPLKDMLEATKRFSQGDFSYRIKQDSRNTVKEFETLSSSFNAMAENLEQTENTRVQFVANVSHELKTPMTTIGGFIDGILDGTIDAEHQNHYLLIVSDEIKRLSSLVVSMLNMSKVEAGQLRIQPERYNLTNQIVGIFMSFEQKIEDKQISIKGLDVLSDVYIEADMGMINQVFYNLIDNAVKFTPKNGDISAKISTDGEFVTISIKNTGAGINSEDIDHIFERFYKGDKSRSLDTKSVGLGLFIVKSIVNLHGGDIEATSVPDRYTQFTVKLKNKLISK